MIWKLVVVTPFMELIVLEKAADRVEGVECAGYLREESVISSELPYLTHNSMSYLSLCLYLMPVVYSY